MSDSSRSPTADEMHACHVDHCCVLHGCKYNQDDICPVVQRRAIQHMTCETCEEEGLTAVPMPTDHDYDVLMMSPAALRAEVLRLRNLIRVADKSMERVLKRTKAVLKRVETKNASKRTC